MNAKENGTEVRVCPNTGRPIDAGSWDYLPAELVTDIDGDARIIAQTPDLGCDEARQE